MSAVPCKHPLWQIVAKDRTGRAIRKRRIFASTIEKSLEYWFQITMDEEGADFLRESVFEVTSRLLHCKGYLER